MKINQNSGRVSNMIRPINLKYDLFGNAIASVLFESGNTKVLVSVSMQDGVPQFLKGQKQGWLAAEYAMLPCAPSKRIMRESNSNNKNGRSVEISRLIGRVLRSVIDFSAFPDRTINIDCDVLTADGGTRVACISAASVALKLAQARWLELGIISRELFKEEIAAISVGKVGEKFYLDLDFSLDSSAGADFNFVLTRSGKLIEIQGTAEKEPLSMQDFEELKNLAISGIKQVFEYIDKLNLSNNININNNKENKVPLFSLANRLNNNLE
ncbi:MAG: Ribonuclease PH [candidate division TM6 bacterium GW2011_GWF2_28_16]|nr:MAG: Ribonuclease PH [candidate division TM6 bacterium GW2011_GWF2_28_16]